MDKEFVPNRGSKREQSRIADIFRLAPRSGQRAIDIGARDGYLSKRLVERFDSVVALDLERPRIEHPRIASVAVDLTSLEFPDRHFDFVLCSEARAHPASFAAQGLRGNRTREPRLGTHRCAVPPGSPLWENDVPNLRQAESALWPHEYVRRGDTFRSLRSACLDSVVVRGFGQVFQQSVVCGTARFRRQPVRDLRPGGALRALWRIDRFTRSAYPESKDRNKNGCRNAWNTGYFRKAARRMDPCAVRARGHAAFWRSQSTMKRIAELFLNSSGTIGARGHLAKFTWPHLAPTWPAIAGISNKMQRPTDTRSFSVAHSKKRIKSWLKHGRVSFDRIWYPFTPADIGDALGVIGIRRGDSLLVHSSYDAFRGFRGKPSDVIVTLQEAVGPAGMVMMPTMPFTDAAVEYARSNPVLDVRRTPSRMGLLTEMFRRLPGVIRSPHPTHPVAIWGDEAGTVASEHYLARTPCGRGSPFEHLLKREGKILLLGTGIGVLTFYHFVEEELEHLLPSNPFTDELFSLKVIDAAGAVFSCETRLFDPAVSRRRNLDRLTPELSRAGALRSHSVGKLDLTVLGAQAVLDATRRLAGTGAYVYE